MWPHCGLARLLRQLGQHTHCVHNGLARGGCAPLRTPGLSRRCRSTGRPGAQPPDPRTRARTAQRRTAVVAADLTPAEQVAFDQAAEALRLPKAGERASETVSVARELSPDLRVPFEDRAAYGAAAGLRRDPPQTGPEAFPQGSIAPEARAGSDPDHGTTGVTSAGFLGRRTSVRRGVAPSPTLRPKAERGFASGRAKRNGANGFREQQERNP